MPKLPRPREVERVLRKLEFRSVRQSGSHIIFKDSSGKRVTLPMHGGKTISPGVFFFHTERFGFKREKFLGYVLTHKIHHPPERQWT